MPDHPDLLPTLRELANVLCNQGKLREAESVARRLIRITDRAHGPLDPRMIPHLLTLAETLRALDRPDEAKSTVTRCLAIIESLSPHQQTEISDTIERADGWLGSGCR